LLANCSPCHSTGSSGGHSAASDYDDAVRVADEMVDEISGGDMPPNCNGGDPGDANCVSEEDLAQIEEWVDNDTPE
jgi:mono/diheme cytochrome c family protein